MPDVVAPYNFVPLSGKVVAAPEFDAISHDRPLADGIRGHLDLSLIAVTPVCVGGLRADGVVHPFQTPDDTYAIPGTALKGMIRNVVEIITFSKMSLVDRKRRFAVRDLQNPKVYGRKMTSGTGKVFASRVLSGWLRQSSDGWTIEPCNYARVEQRDLLALLGQRSVELRGAIRERKRARDKYGAWDAACSTREIVFDPGAVTEHLMSRNKGRVKFRTALNLGRGATMGTLVMTGQPSRQKHREFIFYGTAGEPLTLEPRVFDDFRLNHSESRGQHHGGSEEPNEEWAYWLEMLAKTKGQGRVPVFYLTDRPGHVASLGLAQMYRLAYDHTVGDTIDAASIHHDPEPTGWPARPDYADALFGRVQPHEQGGESLKGRVDFGLFRASKRPKLSKPYTATLSSPKASYYPSYLVQNESSGRVTGDYKTYQDDDAEARGWKRYPVRLSVSVPETPPGNSTSEWRAVREGTRFDGRMRLHNLRLLELGALAWALTFGDDHRALCHSVGYARPFGFGAVRLKVRGGTLWHNGSAQSSDEDAIRALLRKAMAAFEEAMTAALGHPWRDTPQLAQLLAMADPSHAAGHDLRYMSIGHGHGGDTNEFQKAKARGAQRALPPYIAFAGKSDAERYKRKLVPKQRMDYERALEDERKEAIARRIQVEKQRKQAEERRNEEVRRHLLGAPGRLAEDHRELFTLNAKDQARKLLDNFTDPPGTVPPEESDDPAAWLDALANETAEGVARIRQWAIGPDGVGVVDQNLGALRDELRLHIATVPHDRRWRRRRDRLQKRVECLERERSNTLILIERLGPRARRFLEWLDWRPSATCGSRDG